VVCLGLYRQMHSGKCTALRNLISGFLNMNREDKQCNYVGSEVHTAVVMKSSIV
jgi:hypothetical protein